MGTKKIKQEKLKPQVPAVEKTIFALSDAYGGGASALIGALYFAFLVAMDIGTIWAGAIVAISKVWDAISDPLMGVISDNTRSKWGRRRPYIFLGGVLLVFSLAFLFVPLQGMSLKGAKIAIYLVAFLFYNTVATIICVSYSSFSTEISTSPKETTQINSLRLVFSMISSGISAIGGTLILDNFLSGKLSALQVFLIITLGFGIFYAIPLILTGLFTEERAPLPDVKSTFSFKTFLAPFKVKTFVFLLLAYLFAFMCMDIITANIVYFAVYGLEAAVSGTILLIVIMVVTFFTIPLYYYLMQKGFAKPVLFNIGIPLYILGIILLTMVPIKNPAVVYIFCVIIGLGLGGSQMMPWIIFPDVIDVAELQLGERPTGSFSGVMTFIRKSSSALAIFLTGLILKLVGFNEPKADSQGNLNYNDFQQKASAIWGLRLLIMLSVLIFMMVAFFSMYKLKLTPKLSEKIRKLLDKRNSNEEFSEEDQADYDEIKKQLF